MFSWQKQYLTRSLRSLVRYCFCHSNIKSISLRNRLISYINVFQTSYILCKFVTITSNVKSIYMLIVNLYFYTVRALAMPYNNVMRIRPNKASFPLLMAVHPPPPPPPPTPPPPPVNPSLQECKTNLASFYTWKLEPLCQDNFDVLICSKVLLEQIFWTLVY
jgi:hypothetical protein